MRADSSRHSQNTKPIGRGRVNGRFFLMRHSEKELLLIRFRIATPCKSIPGSYATFLLRAAVVLYKDEMNYCRVLLRHRAHVCTHTKWMNSVHRSRSHFLCRRRRVRGKIYYMDVRCSERFVCAKPIYEFFIRPFWQAQAALSLLLQRNIHKCGSARIFSRSTAYFVIFDFF